MLKKSSWYIGGLHFNCRQCGRCCSGPEEGNIWVSKPEINLIADFLKISVRDFKRQYLHRRCFRTTIIEQPVTKDCIFLKKIDGSKKCIIYPVRPNQCRTWPFWSDNLVSPDSWNRAAKKCMGINQEKLYTYDQIEKIRKSKWWLDEK